MKLGTNISVAIDALGIDQPGGARTATLFLLAKAVVLEPNWHFIIFVSKVEPLLKQKNVQQVILPLRKGPIARFIFQLYLLIYLMFHKVDLVHFTKSQASLVLGHKSILTIFDMTTLLYPGQFTRFSVWYWRHIQKRMAKKMSAITTISHDAAKDIVRLFGIDEKKVHTIYLASQFTGTPDNSIENQTGITDKLPAEFMLYVGLLAKKKNLDTVVRAVRILKDQGKTAPKLVLVGPRYLASDASDILDLIHKLGLDDDIQYFGKVSAEDLKNIYKHATLLLQPSVHEGFGLTAMEALDFGVPVIASNAASLPEIIGDGGLLVSEYMSPEAWADAIWTLSTDKALRSKVIVAGKDIAERFSWEKSAQELIALYSTVLSDNENEISF